MLFVCNIINNVVFVIVYSKGCFYVKRCFNNVYVIVCCVFLVLFYNVFFIYIFIYLLVVLVLVFLVLMFLFGSCYCFWFKENLCFNMYYCFFFISLMNY